MTACLPSAPRSPRSLVSFRALALCVALIGGACELESQAQEDPVSWSRVSLAERISATLPSELELAETGGADSVVRQYRSRSLALLVDYGWYGDALDDANGEALARRSIELDGRAAVLVTYRDADASAKLPYVAALHVPDLGRGAVKLTVVTRADSAATREQALRILRSLRFEDSP